MTGYRFYAEMPDHWRSKSASLGNLAFTRSMLAYEADMGRHCNCIALICEPGERNNRGGCDAVGTVRSDSGANAEVASTSATPDYLHERCVRVSAELAARLHPALFQYLYPDAAKK